MLVQKGAPELPVYEVPTEKSGTAVEKHYYMVLTLADEGVLACEALRSGTTTGKLQDPSAIEYWFDHLVKLGLGTAERERELRQRKWQVRRALLHQACHQHGCAANPHAPATHTAKMQRLTAASHERRTYSSPQPSCAVTRISCSLFTVAWHPRIMSQSYTAPQLRACRRAATAPTAAPTLRRKHFAP